MKLIDAYKFSLYLSDMAMAVAPHGWKDETEQKINEAKYNTINDIMQALDEEPTAYDVNRVINQLEIYRSSILIHSPDNETLSYSSMTADECIEIVKAGGLEEGSNQGSSLDIETKSRNKAIDDVISKIREMRLHDISSNGKNIIEALEELK